jgi:glucans biosynthesis protein
MLRQLAIGFVLMAASAAVLAQEEERPTEPFDRAILEARAAELAASEHALPPPEEADGERLNYEQYRAINFERGASIWARENRTFTVDLLYPGFIFDTPVNINLVVGKTARRVLFTNEVFEYGAEVARLEKDPALGYSGFSVRAPLNQPDQQDQFLVFQGASYFRAAAREQILGLSARGLAVRTARPEGEEFPVFTDFWLERPAEGATEIVIHALLQSPSVVGAYTFRARPGDETIVDVDVALFSRVELAAFGIAPLTSMFLFDASNRTRFDDYRNAVHDSDGLQIMNGRGERLWRPIANPRALQLSSFVDDSPKGFGLVQRKRRFADYEDAEALFDRRPSLWIEPKSEWGPGHVELVEIPSEREMNDNIIAYWQPAAPLVPGEPGRFAYRLRFTGEPLDASLARVVATRSGRAPQGEGRRSFVIDYQGEGDLPSDLEVVASTSTGEVLEPRGHAVDSSGVYRVHFELDPGRDNLAELRVEVRSKGEPWGETWLYRWTR